jgi:hypothetical protein
MRTTELLERATNEAASRFVDVSACTSKPTDWKLITALRDFESALIAVGGVTPDPVRTWNDVVDPSLKIGSLIANLPLPPRDPQFSIEEYIAGGSKTLITPADELCAPCET